MLPEPRPTHARVAIVTGGARGIGSAIVEQLARAGLVVLYTYLQQEERAFLLADRLRRDGCEVRPVRVDARDIAASRSFVSDTIRERGRLDVLVNNAGVVSDRLFPMMREQDWSDVLSTSLNGLFGATRPAAMQMMRQRTGRIINITSVSGLIGVPGQTNYSAAKAAIIGFTRSLSKELAGWGVSVNAVAPGFIETDMLATRTPEQRAQDVERVPMHRFGSAEEIGMVVRFLALEAPSYLTGQTLAVDGGLSG